MLGLDLLWAALVGDTGTVLFGVVDEPAHLLTCLVALAALAAARGRGLPPLFSAAALLAGVAIDLDHLPGYLGWSGLIGTAPRPYTHSLLMVATLLFFGFLATSRYRVAMLGIAFGVSIHLLRDVATGPGVGLWLPFSSDPVRVSYGLYVGTLVLGATLARGRPAVPRRGGGRRSAVASSLGTSRAVCLLLALVTALAMAAGTETAAAEQLPRRAQVAMGIYVPGGDRDPARLEEFAVAVGGQPALVSSYRSWEELPFDRSSLEAIASRGAIPFVTWEPWGRTSNGYDLGRIAAGEFDSYVTEAAQQAAAWDRPIMVRFAHEMNGNWYPWGLNDPATYKAAWRRVVSIFRREGATNAIWVWTPYVDGGSSPFRRYYPGDAWVDWAGLDGFNWGRPFASFGKIFDDSYRQLVRITAKPLLVGETGSVEGSGASKAVWVRRALRRTLPRLDHIRALVWWSDVHPDGTDWRIDTSSSALAALGSALRAPRYRHSAEFLLELPFWSRR